MKLFTSHQPFELESGAVLPELTLAYHTYGELNETRDNVIWICHALTANSDVQQWWPNMVGEGMAFDTKKYFIICVNIPGSCYGSTGPLSINPKTGQPYYDSFPLITIRDMVKGFQLLAKELSIRKIHLIAGGSMGGYQALEWSIAEPNFIENLFLLVTSARESAWRIAVHTAQRLAIEADETFKQPSPTAGLNGVKAARAIGVLTYRNPTIYEERQTDVDFDKLDNYKASSYIIYQGNKLAERFNAYSYWILTKAMDTHNIARGRSGSVEDVLKSIMQRTLVVGVTSDLLCLLHEQEFLAKHIPLSELVAIDSSYGHDGFLTETETISQSLKKWIASKAYVHDKG
jgi:homoserine O-acetyltransferase